MSHGRSWAESRKRKKENEKNVCSGTNDPIIIYNQFGHLTLLFMATDTIYFDHGGIFFGGKYANGMAIKSASGAGV